jgi:hypothetical protein
MEQFIQEAAKCLFVMSTQFQNSINLVSNTAL